MYVNLHTLPPGKALFTLFVAQPGDPLELAEEFDVVGPARPPEPSYLASVVILEAQSMLIDMYGDKVEVRGIVNQSGGGIIFDSRHRGFRPIPVVPPARLAESFDRPYDAFLDLCSDEHDGLGTAEYLTFLLEG
jgi:hypothetical protein